MYEEFHFKGVTGHFQLQVHLWLLNGIMIIQSIAMNYEDSRFKFQNWNINYVCVCVCVSTNVTCLFENHGVLTKPP